MAGQPTKKGSWGDWAVIEPKPNSHRISCSFCAFHSSDGSCQVQPIVISDVGYNFWRNCNKFLLDFDHDTTYFRTMVNRIKREDSPYQSYNLDLYRSLHNKAYAASIPEKTTSAVPIKKEEPSYDCHYLGEDKSNPSKHESICTNGRSPYNKSKCRQKCFLYIKSTRCNSGVHLEKTNSLPKNKLPIHDINENRTATIKNPCYYLVGSKCSAYDITCTKSSGKCFMCEGKSLAVSTKKRNSHSKKTITF